MPRSVHEHFEKLMLGQPLDRDDLIWFLLAVGLLIATGHLLTMLITRWGDSRITAKSLLFSLLMHLTCGLGLVSMEPVPLPGRDLNADRESRERTVEVRQLETSENAFAVAEDSGNTPFWAEVNPDFSWNRMDLPLEPEIESDPAERRENGLMTSLIPDRSSFSEAPDRDPDRAQPPESFLPSVADTNRFFDRLERSEPFEVTTPLRKRLNLNASGFQQEDTDGQIRQGGADRIVSRLDPTKNLLTPDLPRNDQSDFPLPESDLAESYQPRESPVPSPLPDESPGPLASSDNTGRAIRPDSRERFNVRNAGPSDTEPSSTDPLVRRNPDRINPGSSPKIMNVASGSTGLPELGSTLPGLEIPGMTPRKPGSVAPTYQLRDLNRRRETARRFGGTERSEQAVEDSLRWLAQVQHPSGFWDADRQGSGKVRFDENQVDREYAGRDSDTGVTALCILAFLGAGYTHEEGQYTENVNRAINWLIDQQDEDGSLYGKANHFARMYCHGMATYALAEAYGMQKNRQSNPRIRPAVENGINHIIQLQNPRDGGWRYGPDQAGDMSMFGWQLMALKSAETAGIVVPSPVKIRLTQFLQSRGRGSNRGLASYREGERVTLPMTAEALFCKQMMGIARSDPASVEAVQYMLQSLPTRTDYNLYYWYYGTLAMYQYGGDAWDQWNSRSRDLIISLQTTSGPLAGSWEPSSRWGSYGGRLYTTAVSTLCLEVYYRLLPLYRMGEPKD